MGADIEVQFPDPGDDPNSFKGYDPQELRKPADTSSPYGNTYNERVHAEAMRRREAKEAARAAEKAQRELLRQQKAAQADASKQARKDFENQIRQQLSELNNQRKTLRSLFSDYAQGQKTQLNQEAAGLVGINWKLALYHKLNKQKEVDANIEKARDKLDTLTTPLTNAMDALKGALRNYDPKAQQNQASYVDPRTGRTWQYTQNTPNFVGPPAPPNLQKPPGFGPPQGFVGPPLPPNYNFIGPPAPPPGTGTPSGGGGWGNWGNWFKNGIGNLGNQFKNILSPNNLAALSTIGTKLLPIIGLMETAQKAGQLADMAVGAPFNILRNNIAGGLLQRDAISGSASAMEGTYGKIPVVGTILKAQLDHLRSMDKTLMEIGKAGFGFGKEFTQAKIFADIDQIRRDIFRAQVLDKSLARWQNFKTAFQRNWEFAQTAFLQSPGGQALMESAMIILNSVLIQLQLINVFLNVTLGPLLPVLKTVSYLQRLVGIDNSLKEQVDLNKLAIIPMAAQAALLNTQARGQTAHPHFRAGWRHGNFP